MTAQPTVEYQTTSDPSSASTFFITGFGTTGQVDTTTTPVETTGTNAVRLYPTVKQKAKRV